MLRSDLSRLQIVIHKMQCIRFQDVLVFVWSLWCASVRACVCVHVCYECGSVIQDPRPAIVFGQAATKC